jgi:large subunit ribosomal protein L27
MSKKKAGGKTGQHVRPSGKRLGVKTHDGQKVSPGMIILRQRGMKITLGKGVAAGRDHTIYSVAKGLVKFGTRLGKKVVSVK